MVDALSADADHIQQLREQQQGGRPASAATAHIRQLVADNADLKPAALYKLRDQSIIKFMDKGSWRARIAEARRK